MDGAKPLQPLVMRFTIVWKFFKNQLPTPGRSRASSSSFIPHTSYLIPFLLLLLSGCYSFKGGTTPSYLHTVTIPAVEDVSGFFRATVRDDLRRLLIQKFREDNSLRVVDDQNADSRLNVTITGIVNNARRNVSGKDLETTRAVVLDARVTFDDNVKKRPLYKDQTFHSESTYSITEGTAGEDRAFSVALDLITTDILNRSVANW